MKVGIIGSSFSVGSHLDKATGMPIALPFEHWFKNYCDHKFYNVACSGRGTELYLSKLTYLKKTYDIDTVLIELVNNRSLINVNLGFETEFAAINNINDINPLYNKMVSSSSGMHQFKCNIYEQEEFEEIGIPKTLYKPWFRLQESFAANMDVVTTWSIFDIKEALDLCDLLNITPILWMHHWHFESLPLFSNLIQGRKYIKFPNAANADEYYTKKYDWDSVHCDESHFHDHINDEMIRDFIAPAINSVT